MLDVRCFFLGEATVPSPFACCCIFGHADIRGMGCLRVRAMDVGEIGIFLCAPLRASTSFCSAPAEGNSWRDGNWSERSERRRRFWRSRIFDIPPPYPLGTASSFVHYLLPLSLQSGNLIYRTVCRFPPDWRRACSSIGRANAPVSLLCQINSTISRDLFPEMSQECNLDGRSNLDNCLGASCEPSVSRNAHVTRYLGDLHISHLATNSWSLTTRDVDCCFISISGQISHSRASWLWKAR